MPSTDIQSAYGIVRDLYLKGRYRQALKAADALERQRPGHLPFIGLQVSCLLRLSRPTEAARVTRRALRQVTVPAHRAMLVAQLVEAHSQLNHFEDAIDLARAEHERDPTNMVVTGSLIHILSLAGRKEEAIAIALGAIAQGQVSLSIAASFAEAALRTDHAPAALEYLERAMAAQPQAPAELQARGHTEAGHLLDRLKRYDEAFEHFRLANAAIPAEYDDAAQTARRDNLIESYTAESFARCVRPAAAGPRPVFIVGMPRSGTTLTEQIIAAHPRAFGAGELSTINELFRDLATEEAAGIAPDKVSPARIAEAAAAYRAEIARLAGPGDFAVITDKAPTNFWYLGFIAHALPDARVIHCRRDPRDTCLSCYFQALSAAHSYSFDLRSCGLYYRHYRAIMAHYRALAADPRVGLNLLEIDYEDTVADQEAQTRRLLDFVGLDFHPDCLKFNESGRVARTLSNDQVRQPIYKSSTKRYERYAKHLGPLIEALGDTP